MNPRYSEKQKLKKLHVCLRTEYREAGITDEQIDDVFSSDWEMYGDDRDYHRHVVSVPDVGVYLKGYEARGGFVPGPASKDSPEFDEFMEGLTNESLRIALSELSAEDRKLVYAVYVEEIPVSEIAKMRGMSADDTESRLAAVMKFLRTRMEESKNGGEKR